jgi:uncharacterized damage-inducible protein DinB
VQRLKIALQTQLDYSAWANQRLLSACAPLNADELNRDLKVSHATVLANLRHTYYSERVWLERLREGELPPLAEIGDQNLFRDPDPEPQLADLQRTWPLVWTELSRLVDDLPASSLAGELVGPDFQIVVWKLLIHVVNHSSLHRGQVISMLRQLGQIPPNLDIFSFYTETSAR